MLTLQDADAELVARGFGGFTPNQRFRYINWGYFHIAKQAQWTWETKTESLDFAVGEFRKELAATWSGTKFVVVTSPDTERGKLPALSDVRFLEDWYALDLAGASGRGRPEQYYIWTEDGKHYLYLLPPPDSARTITHVFSQRVVALTEAANVSITPDELDEAIVLAALVRCHIRANEWDLAMNVRAMLEEQYDLQLSVDEETMDEEPERVLPYPWP